MSCSRSFVGAAFDALPAHVAILDADGTIVYTNDAWDAFGDDEGLQSGTGGVGTNYLAVCDVPDGDGSQAARGIRAVADGRRDRFSLEYPCHSPDRRRWFTMEAAAYDHDGQRYVLVMHVDVTERRRLERQARDQAERMEAFATLLSHDLRNPLAVATAEAESLSTDEEGPEVASIRSSLERMASIVDDALLLASTVEVDSPDVVPLDDAVETAWNHVERGDASLVVAGTATIRADGDLLSHLLENLFRNAVEHGSASSGSDPRTDSADEQAEATAIEVGPLSSVEAADPASSRERSESGTDPGPSDRDARRVDGFYVEDDGPGIPPSERERVFDSGHTTSGGGTGFGLAIVERVADAHGWSVAITDGADGGARFEIRGIETVSKSPARNSGNSE